DKKTLTDTRTGMNIDIADQTSDKGQQARRITPARQPQTAADAMQQDRVYAGIRRQHFQRRTRGRIALKYTAHIIPPLPPQRDRIVDDGHRYSHCATPNANAGACSRSASNQSSNSPRSGARLDRKSTRLNSS